jgi:hypothetical protein
MILTIQLLAVVLCAVSAAMRAPAALKGRSVPLFFCFLLMTVAVTLSIQQIYSAVDAVLGGLNLANVALRMALFSVFLTLGTVIARAFDARSVERLIGGRPGLWAVGLAAGTTVVAFLLGAYGPDGALRALEPAGLFYANTWRFYLAYVAACLLVTLVPTALDPRRSSIYRWSAGFQSIGFLVVAVVPFAILAATAAGAKTAFLDNFSQASIILVAAGLMLIWIAARRFRHAVPSH